ncbi:hypothetical protein BH20ACI1_BH20ACI1_08100 [soil metagenome]
MEYTWDEFKAEKIKRKHAIEFAKIVDIFEDSFAIEFIDEEHSTEKEIRYAIIGLTSYGLVYFVFAEPNENELHFITARLAENWMVRDYDKNRRRY